MNTHVFDLEQSGLSTLGAFNPQSGAAYYVQGQTLTGCLLASGERFTRELGFSPTRTVHTGTRTVLVGPAAQLCLDGHQLVTDAPQVPLELELDGRLGQTLAEDTVRGSQLRVYPGLTFSSFQGTLGRLVYGPQPEHGEIYAHPSLALIAVSHAEGLYYTLDHGTSWLFRELGEWPCYLKGRYLVAEHGAVWLKGRHFE